MFLLINKMYDVPNIILESEVALVSEMKLVNNIIDWVVDIGATRTFVSARSYFLIMRE